MCVLLLRLPAQHAGVRGEEDRLCRRERVVQVARRLVDLAPEDERRVEPELEEARAPERVDPTLVVVPDTDHGERDAPTEVDKDEVPPIRRERGEPEVLVVARLQHAVRQV